MLKNVIMYLIVVNLLAFAAFGADKQKAKSHQWRISENTLLGIALCGGSLGAIMGMRKFRHKTRHRRFAIGLPILFLVQTIVFIIFSVYRR